MELHAALDRIEMKHARYSLDTIFLIIKPLERIIQHIGEHHQATPFLTNVRLPLNSKLL